MSIIETTANKITTFRNIHAGWHFGRGTPPGPATIDDALKLNMEAWYAGFSKTNAFLGSDGEIRVTAYQGTLYLELTVEISGKVTYVVEQGNEEIVYEDNLSVQEAIARIRKLRGQTWASFASSTKTTTITIKDVSKASRSSHPVTEVEFPLSMKTVSYEQAPASVRTSNDTIKMNQESRLSSGISLHDYFLKSAS